MTTTPITPSPVPAAGASPLRTQVDVTARVASLVGPAAHPGQLWLLTVDGDDRQTPVLVPVPDLPTWPEDDLVDALAAVLAQLGDDLGTDAGEGSVVLVLERFGPARPDTADRAWAHQLRHACTRAGVALRGVWLSSDDGVDLLR